MYFAGMNSPTLVPTLSGRWGSTIIFAVAAPAGILLGAHVVWVGVLVLAGMWVYELGHRAGQANAASEHGM